MFSSPSDDYVGIVAKTEAEELKAIETDFEPVCTDPMERSTLGNRNSMLICLVIAGYVAQYFNCKTRISREGEQLCPELLS